MDQTNFEFRTAATKETAEALTPIVKVIDSIYQSTNDGTPFNLGQDYPNFIDDLLSIQPAIDGLNQVDEESITQTEEDRNQIKAVLRSNMPNVPAPQSYLVVDIIMGLHAGASLAWRRGFNAGQDHILAGKAQITA